MGVVLVPIMFGIFYLLQMTILFRCMQITKRAKAMLLLWIINLPLISITYVVFCGFDILGLGLCLFFFFAGFFGGILQLYNLADRGFSLRILIDFLLSKQSELSVADVMRIYSDGRGIAWMYNKRIDNMLDNELINMQDNQVSSTHKGSWLSVIFTNLRRIYNLDLPICL